MVRSQIMPLPLPFPVVLALLAVMGSAVAYGFFGRPAARQRPLSTMLLLGLGLLALPVSMGCIAIREPRLGLLVVVVGVVLFSAAAHLLRAPDPGGGGGGGGRGGDDDGSDIPGGPRGGVDWDAFDRERAGWAGARPLTRA